MRILFLSAANSIHTVKWVNALAKRGHEVHLIYNAGHEPKNDVLSNEIKCYCLKYSGGIGYYRNAKELRHVTRKIEPDVINVHYASGYGTLARRAKIGPILLSVWGSDVYDFPYESRMKNKILKKNVKYAKALASTSFCMAEQLRKVMQDKELEIAITPFGVDIQKFDLKCYLQKSDKTEIIIGNIKLLEAKYGIKELITAFVKLKDEMKNEKALKLYIYGDGSLRGELEELIHSLNMQDAVFLKGRIANAKVPEALNEFDIFCALSQLDSESFGVAVVEAMAMGKPVVVSDVDGFCEVVKDNETGYIVQRKNIEEIVAKLKKLILDEELREQLGKAGRKRVEEKYDWEKNVDTMLEVYQKVIR